MYSEQSALDKTQLMLLDAGECLVDDLLVSDKDGKAVVSESFDGETKRWRAFGTHLESGVVCDSPFASSPCYRIVATGRGNSRHNYVSLDLDPAFPEGANYTVSFRVRWLNGCSLLLSRTSGQGLARTHQLVVPKAARERLRLRPGMRITVVGKGDVLFLVPQRAVRKARGLARGTRAKGLRDKKDRH